jgi:hypothetical protein
VFAPRLFPSLDGIANDAPKFAIIRAGIEPRRIAPRVEISPQNRERVIERKRESAPRVACGFE